MSNEPLREKLAALALGEKREIKRPVAQSMRALREAVYKCAAAQGRTFKTWTVGSRTLAVKRVK